MNTMPTLAVLLLALVPQAEEDLEKRRDRLAAKLEELRGLKFKTPLKIRLGTRREYGAYALENARRVYGADLGRAEKGLKALGLVPGRVRLELAITAHAGLTVKTFTANGELILLDAKAGDDWLLNKMALGLLDQHHSPKIAPTYDAQMAFSALRMGDAEVAKHLLWHGGKLPEGYAGKVLEETVAWEVSDSKLASAVVPRLFVRTGDFSWRRGAAFAHGLFAGGGAAGLDKAWARPPVSTEQVLHPEKYAKEERPVEIDLGEVDGYLEAEGYKPIYRTVLGELGAALVLETHFPKDDLAAATGGWGGDAFAVYEREGAAPMVVWATEWDAEADAREFHREALRTSLKVMPPEPQLLAPALRRKTAVLFAVNVPKDLQDGLLEAAWKCRRSGARAGALGE